MRLTKPNAMNRAHFDDDPEHARVFAVQQFLLPQSPRAVCDEIGLNWWAALKLHEDGWLSFNPETTPQLDEATDAEIRFVGSLIGAGCDDGLLRQLLGGLPKPYRYRGRRIYYDWAARRWRLLPEPEREPDPRAIFSDCLESLGADGDVASLEQLKEEIAEALESAHQKAAGNS